MLINDKSQLKRNIEQNATCTEINNSLYTTYGW